MKIRICLKKSFYSIKNNIHFLLVLFNVRHLIKIANNFFYIDSIYGALLVVSGPRSKVKINIEGTEDLESSGPGSLTNYKNEEDAVGEFVDEFIEIVNSLILRCLGILDLVDGIGSAQEALDKTENILHEKNILRNEVIALSDFKYQSEIKYLKIQEDFNALKKSK